MLLIGSLASLLILGKHLQQLKTLQAWPVHVLFSFFLWLAFHILFLAGNHEEQWRELTGDWLRNSLAACMGLALGILVRNPAQHLSLRLQRIHQSVLIWGLAGTTVIFCVRYAYEIAQTGQWVHTNFYMTPYLGKTPLVIFGSILLPVMFIKALSALQRTERPIWYLYSFAGLIATVLMYYFANTKNGFAMFALLMGGFLISVLLRRTHFKMHRIGLATSIMLGFLVFGYAASKHIETNPAWSNLVSDYKISIQIDQHNNWKDNTSPFPNNENGTMVDVSTYQRVSWARAGLELLKDHPLGYGLIKHSFGALAIQKWSDFHKPDGNNRGATHSGWLDFALAFGIPGLLLVWIPLIASYLRAKKHTDFWSNYIVWTIPLIAISYLTTEVCTGHFIELLFFLTALFSGLTLPNDRETSDANAD
ncbi:O-antigen ligase family protein [Rhodoferax bucti]|uniref:O-antigen ligase family protein n=1 Tax=Rhodoferax bucti TaxID=2576305 RepID=UPI0014777B06|nr:O-antigen ligase family protein [Rhodoferax bucti]